MNELWIDEAHLADDIQSLVAESITNASPLRITATEITAATEASLNHIIRAILEKFGAPDLFTTVSLTLKELATNAVKANLKHHLRSLSPQTDQTAFMNEFRAILGSQGISAYVPALKAAGLSVIIRFKFGPSGLELSITNPFALPESEKQRLNEKLAAARSNPDLRKLHEQNRQDAEGAGLGMVMVMNALKSSGIQANALTYDLHLKYETSVRVFFPFADGAKHLEK